MSKINQVLKGLYLGFRFFHIYCNSMSRIRHEDAFWKEGFLSKVIPKKHTFFGSFWKLCCAAAAQICAAFSKFRAFFGQPLRSKALKKFKKISIFYKKNFILLKMALYYCNFSRWFQKRRFRSCTSLRFQLANDLSFLMKIIFFWVT